MNGRSPGGVAGFHLRPVVDRLAEHLKASTKLFMDETTAPVLDPGRGRTKTGYLWALARDDRNWGGADPPGVVFFYAPGRGGQNAETFLTGFDGILQLDGYTGYNRLTRRSRKGGEPNPERKHAASHAMTAERTKEPGAQNEPQRNQLLIMAIIESPVGHCRETCLSCGQIQAIMPSDSTALGQFLL